MRPKPESRCWDLQTVIAMQSIRRLPHLAIWHGGRLSQILFDEPRPNGWLPDMRNIGKNAQHHHTEVMA